MLVRSMPSEESPREGGLSIKRNENVSRREILKQIGAAGVLVGAAGCLADDDAAPVATPTPTTTDPPTDASTGRGRPA